MLAISDSQASILQSRMACKTSWDWGGMLWPRFGACLRQKHAADAVGAGAGAAAVTVEVLVVVVWQGWWAGCRADSKKAAAAVAVAEAEPRNSPNNPRPNVG